MGISQRKRSASRATLALVLAVSLAPSVASADCTGDGLRTVLDDNRFARIFAVCDVFRRLPPEVQSATEASDVQSRCRDWAASACTMTPEQLHAVEGWTYQQCAPSGRTNDAVWAGPCAPFRSSPEPAGLEAPRLPDLSSSVERLEGFGDSIGDLITFGLASFLIHRAEAELERWATGRLRELVCHEDNRRQFLQNTCTYLGPDSGPNEASIGAGFGQGLFSAIRADLLTLPESLLGAIPEANTTPQATIARWVLGVVSALLDSDSLGAFADHLPSGFPERDKIVLALHLVQGAIDGDVSLSQELLAGVITSQSARLAPATGSGSTASVAAALIDLVAAARGVARTNDSATDRLSAMAPLARSITRLIRAYLPPVPSGQESVVSRAVGGRTLDRGSLRVLTHLLEALAHQDLSGFLTGALRLVPASSTSVQIHGDVIRILSFAAEVAGGDDPEDIERALNMVAAPIGGWEAQLERPRFSIRGLVGGAVGSDVVISGGSGAALSVAPLLAVTMGFTWPMLGSGADAFGYWGIDFCFIDLGAIATYSDGTIQVGAERSVPVAGGALRYLGQTSSEVGLEPGRFLALGIIPRVQLLGPVSLGAMVLWRPIGIAVEGSGPLQSLTVGAFIAIDLAVGSWDVHLRGFSEDDSGQ